MKKITHKQFRLKVACLAAVCLFAACIETQADSIITTVAGSGSGGYAGDGDQATAAELNSPCHVAQDSAGNLYIADTGNHRIRMVDTAGIITTVAGTGADGYSGDGDLAAAAQLNYPQGIALDSAGNLYIADMGNNRIRKVDTAGIITTVAGDGASGYSGDGGLATAARLQYPQGIALDSLGNLYIADTDNQRIRRVDAEGIIYTVAGDGASGYSGDGDPATLAQLNFPTGIALDSLGNLYIADYNNYIIRRVNTSNIISTFAGTGQTNYSGDGGQAAEAGMCPFDIAIDSAGAVYVSDYNNNRIRKIETSGIISTVAGNGSSGYSGDGGQATDAQINYAFSIALSSSGDFYIADTNNNVIRKVVGGATPVPILFERPPFIMPEETTTTIPEDTTTIPEDTTTIPEDTTTIPDDTTTIPEETTTTTTTEVYNGIIITVAGNGSNWYPGDGVPATHAGIHPRSVALDGNGNLYIAEINNHRILKVNTSGIVSTVEGTDESGQAINAPCGLAVDSEDNIIFSDFYNFQIRKINSATGIITTVAGTGKGGYSGDGGPATAAQLYYVFDVAVDGSDNIYVTDSYNQRIRKITASSGIITTVAGTNSAGYSGDGGQATDAQLSYPNAIAVDSSGAVYFADSNNHRIRRISASGIITTVAGTGEGGYSGDGGPATEAQIDYPGGIAVTATGMFYFSDGNRVRRVTASGIIDTVAGTGEGGYSGDGGPAINASLLGVIGLALDSTGANLYIADYDNYRVRKINNLNGGESTTSTTIDDGFIDDDGDGYAAGQDTSCIDRQGDDYKNVVHTLNSNFRLVMPAAWDCDDHNPAVHPGASDANCDGIDNNCDGQTDEDYVSHSTSCGIGACARTGMSSCDQGVEQQNCTPGAPASDNNCDGIDNNCDGRTDEDYVSHSTSCGIGACARTGMSSCDQGVEQQNCTPGSPASDNNCDGIDNNCDGRTDEDYVSHSTSCGIGACARTGMSSCDQGVEQQNCTPGSPASDNNCDGIDNDCDGRTDEGCVTTTTTSTPVTTTIPLPSISQDFNGDRTSDILWRNESTGQVSMMLMNGLTIARSATFAGKLNKAWKIAGTGDFDGDGRADFLWRNESTGLVRMMLMDGLAIARSATIDGKLNKAWKIAGTGDFDGDGKADILWRNESTGQVLMMLMDGLAIARSATIDGKLNKAWKMAGTGDFDGDGKADLLLRNESTGQVLMMLMDGLTIVRSATFYRESNKAWNIAGTGDFDGDGRADILWRNESTGQAYMMLMDGLAIAQSATIDTELNTAWKIVATGDYDGDGRSDILWSNKNSGKVFMMLMDGLNIMDKETIFQQPDTNWQIVGNYVWNNKR